jgi:CelD/BcsL family acetyltransferase involved in cellulose biosynthesis
VPLSWIRRTEGVHPAEWRAVHARSAGRSPFLSPAFLLPWQRAFAADRPVRIARWERDGEAGGFLFLCTRGDGAPGLELMGGHDVADILDAVVAAGEEKAFWEALLSDPDRLLEDGPLTLQCLDPGSATPGILEAICPAHGLSASFEETDRSPRMELPRTFEAYVEGLGKKERHELRRKMRRTAEALPGASLRVCREPGEVAASLPAFLDLHRRSHPDKSAFMSGEMERFFREIAEGFSGEGTLRLAFLGGPGGDAAAAFQVVAGDRLLLYNSGYDPARRDANPGLALIARCVEAAIGEGFREYDFLRGTERYKYDLGGRDRAVVRATVSRG